MAIKTNAMRILESNGIAYEEYSLDIKEALDGVNCANMLGVPLDRTFKTLVTQGKSGNYYVFVVPVAAKLDLKKAANSVGEKNVEMLPMKNLLPITGYVHGGCSPIGMKKVFTTVIDETAILFDKIYLSGGKRGCQLYIDPQVLADFIDAEFADLTKE